MTQTHRHIHTHVHRHRHRHTHTHTHTRTHTHAHTCTDTDTDTDTSRQTHIHPQTHRYTPVSEVSAMLVATTHFLTPSGAFWKILACRSDGSWEYIGSMASGGESSSSDSRSTWTQKHCYQSYQWECQVYSLIYPLNLVNHLLCLPYTICDTVCTILRLIGTHW